MNKRLCTWCGHQGHAEACARKIVVAAGPSGGNGRAVPTTLLPCPCVRRDGAALELVTAPQEPML